MNEWISTSFPFTRRISPIQNSLHGLLCHLINIGISLYFMTFISLELFANLSSSISLHIQYAFLKLQFFKFVKHILILHQHSMRRPLRKLICTHFLSKPLFVKRPKVCKMHLQALRAARRMNKVKPHFQRPLNWDTTQLVTKAHWFLPVSISPNHPCSHSSPSLTWAIAIVF